MEAGKSATWKQERAPRGSRRERRVEVGESAACHSGRRPLLRCLSRAQAPGAPEHKTSSMMQRGLEIPPINTLAQWFDQYGRPLNEPPPGMLSSFHKSHKIVGTVGKSSSVNIKQGRIFMPGHVEDLGMY